jgi:hypothetical protein
MRFDNLTRESIMSAMRIGVLLCLLLLATSCVAVRPAATVPVSASPSLVARDTTAFHRRIASLGGPASYTETRLDSGFDASRVRDGMPSDLVDPRWYVGGPHPFLASVLPGVTFVVVAHGSWRSGGFIQGSVTTDGRFYQNENLNSLLLAEGYTFDSTEFRTISKIAVLLQYLASPPLRVDSADRGMLDRPLNPIQPGTVAVPSVDFRSFTSAVTKQPNGAVDTRLTVICTIDGIDETAVVDFHGTADGRNSLGRFTSPDKYLPYQPGRLPEPDPTRRSK